MNIFKNQKQMMILSWTAVLLWLILIFSLSAQPAEQSNKLSKKVTEIIIDTIDQVATLDIEKHTTMDLIKQFNHIVRKYAHGGIYFMLGVLMVNAWRRSGVRNFKALLFSFVLCVIYAISDEVHQLFVPGRGAQVLDVLIDSAGAMVGIGMYKMVVKKDRF